MHGRQTTCACADSSHSLTLVINNVTYCKLNVFIGKLRQLLSSNINSKTELFYGAHANSNALCTHTQGKEECGDNVFNFIARSNLEVINNLEYFLTTWPHNLCFVFSNWKHNSTK